VVLWHGKIGGLEQQHRQKCEKERVKWQERITAISVSAGSSDKNGRGRCNNMEIGQFIRRRCNNMQIDQFYRKRGVTAWKSTNLSEEGVIG
jgi:hypothetical protein